MLVVGFFRLLNSSKRTCLKRNFQIISMQTSSFSFKRTYCKTSSMDDQPEYQKWDMTSEEILENTEDLMESARKVYDEVASVDISYADFKNTIKPIADMNAWYSIARNNFDFYQHVHPDKTLRDASTTSDKKMSQFEVEMSMRQDVFDRILAVSQRNDVECSDEGHRLIERMIKLGMRNGLHLDKDVQDKIKEIKKQQTDLGIDFQKNLNEENQTLSFLPEDLKGLPPDFINSLDKNDDKTLKVTLKYPHYFPIMKKCSRSKTREAMEHAFNSRCKEANSKILTELIKLRAEKAKLLGYKNHAAFIHEMRMAKHPDNVVKFTQSLADKLKPLGESDRKKMLEMKVEDCEHSGEEFDGRINMWDLRFYMTRIEEEQFSVDQNKLKTYFPLDVVTKGLLEIYQQLLGLKFERICDPQVWHDDVSLYSVKNSGDGRTIGFFFLDLHPREGKYGHAACFGLVPGCINSSGKRQLAVAAMVANFSKPTDEAPSLLTHDEVETFFHEFGHVMHQICAEAEYEMFSGTNVERDFVEAPSQMLENWCWESEPLRKMSKHYKTGEELPDEMIKTLIKSRNANTGVFYLRQITLGTLDLTIHTKDDCDITEVYADACEKILGIPASTGTCMPATFGHLAGGYDAQYYGYLWSQVLCFDMFHSRFLAEGIMSDSVGLDYRNKILKPGGSLDADVMLHNFLGRVPNQDAFLRAKGLDDVTR